MKRDDMKTNFRMQAFAHLKNPNRRIAARTILAFLPIFLSILIGSIIILILQDKLEMDAYKNVQKSIVDTKLKNIESEIQHVIHDINIIKSSNHLTELIEGNNTTENIEDLSDVILNVVKYQKVYDQVRIIDENGNEILRVNNNNNGNPIVIPKNQLQNKKDRYYFKEACKLDRDIVFVSPLDLNIEQGEIEQPLKPMIRFATPLFDKGGVRHGILLINFLGQNILNLLDSYEHSSLENQLMLLNKDGYWLKGPLAENEWGFMYENKKDLTFANRYKEAWESLKNENFSQFKTPQGLFTSNTIYPLLEGQKFVTDTGKASLSGETTLISKSYFWKIISFIPSEELYAERNKRRENVTLLLTFLAICLLYISWRLSKAQYLQKEALKALKKSNETKDKFFSIIAHDLKSPFNAMLGFSNMLNDNFDDFDQKEHKEFFGIIHKNLNNIYRLLDNLLLWSLSQIGKFDFNPEKINLYLLIHESNELLKQSAEIKSIKIINQISKNIYVDADKDMLSTIIRNLLSNAIKFTPKEGEITITATLSTTKKNKSFTTISIKDCGVGIDKKKQSKLFDFSENISTKGTENETGTGLGLILCKEFVEKHSGKIWIESEVGKGSVISFTISVF